MESRALLLALLASCAPAPRREPPEPAAASERGRELYRDHCAVCHGDLGRGDGPAAPHLFPPARDFSTGRFRLVSTASGVPTDDDLLATLRGGMPGSAMPPWDWMPEPDLRELARVVRELAARGLAEDLVEEALDRGEALDEGPALARARERLEPAEPLDVDPVTPPGGADPALGERLYEQHCAACHGPDGRGDGMPPRWTAEGELHWARDFRAGFLKGGATRRDLALRIEAGMPGSSMPALRLPPVQRDALVAYLQELIPLDAHARYRHARQELRAARVAEAPLEPDDPRWAGAEEVSLHLAPLAWRGASVLGARLAALHDGRALSVRVAWDDPTREGGALVGALLCDAAALQLSRDARPPLYGMGSSEHPTVLWHWRAARLEESAGVLDLIERPPHAREAPFARSDTARADVPVYRLGVDLETAAEGADTLLALGVDRLEELSHRGVLVQARARYADGGWSVVFASPLGAGRAGSRELDPLPGDVLQIACAVWNGAAEDAGAQKSVSVWHGLRLDP